MKAGINLCVKKIPYTILQKQKFFAQYKIYSVLLYN